MMFKAVMLISLSLLSGCVVTSREVSISDYYTRAEIDAINAEAQCRALARSLVQVSRCGVRR